MAETHTHVAAVFSMKKRWLERNPEAARLRIRVTSKSSVDRIQSAETPQNDLSRKYRCWVKEEPKTACASEIDAWEAAIRIRDSVIADGRRLPSAQIRKVRLPEHQARIWFSLTNTHALRVRPPDHTI